MHVPRLLGIYSAYITMPTFHHVGKRIRGTKPHCLLRINTQNQKRFHHAIVEGMEISRINRGRAHKAVIYSACRSQWLRLHHEPIVFFLGSTRGSCS